MKKKACIVRPHNAGLFSQINKVVTCATLYDHVHVDWTGNTTYGSPKEDLWPRLFKPTVNKGGEVVVDYPNREITGTEAGNIYGTDWRGKYHEAWKKFTVQPILTEAARIFVKYWPEPAVGCLVRFHGHHREQLSDKSQQLSDYVLEIEKRLNQDTPIYVMSGDEETLQYFRERYGSRVSYWTDVRRTKTRDTNQMDATRQTFVDAEIALVEVLVMSHCRALIHPTSNMATSALYMNPKLEGVYLK